MSEIKPHQSLFNEFNIFNFASEYAQNSPQDILKFALEQFDNIAISFSGAEDVILIDMASKLRNNDFQVFSIDTGRLHPETYEFIDKVRQHYGIKIEVIFPEAKEVETLVKEKGLFSFYIDGHQECCSIRKVRSLHSKLATLDAWITGQRQDQNPATRSKVPIIQADTAFSTSNNILIKFNPLTYWNSDQVWEYIQVHKVPYNKLHNRGFISIGCEPCTRSVLPHQHERLGRWWWEKAIDKECGFHSMNNSQ